VQGLREDWYRTLGDAKSTKIVLSKTGEELVGLSCRGTWQHIATKNMPQQIKTVPLANFGIIATYRNMLDCSMTLEQATVHEEPTPHERS